MRDWIQQLLTAASAIIGIAVAPHALRAEDNPLKSFPCDRAPISVEGLDGVDQCFRGQAKTVTRNTCLTREYLLTGKTAAGLYYLVDLNRLDSGNCNMTPMREDQLETVIKKFNAADGSDFSAVQRMAEAFTIDFKRPQQTCFAFTSAGGTISYTGKAAYVVMGQFCTGDPGGFDDTKKRDLMAAVKVAP